MVVICNSSVQIVNCSVLNEGGAGSGSQEKITIFLVKSADLKEISPNPAKETGMLPKRSTAFSGVC